MDNKKLYEIFNNSTSISDVLKKLNMCDNSNNWRKITQLMLDCNFDKNLYKKRKERFCLNCDEKLNKNQKKYCSKSCSTTDRNKKRIVSNETKNKIRNKLSKQKIIKYCLNCDSDFETKNIKQKFCNKHCSAVFINKNIERIDKLSKSRINKIIEGKVNNYGIKMIYKFKDGEIKCDSKIEYSCLNYFELKGATLIERCNFYIKYDDNGKNRRYNPDFKIKIDNEIYIVECKSYISSNNLNEKWRNYNENSILKKELLKKYCEENGYLYFWFTKDLNRKYYDTLKNKGE